MEVLLAAPAQRLRCPPAQRGAAQYFAREQTGEDRIDALAPLHVERGDGHILPAANATSTLRSP